MALPLHGTRVVDLTSDIAGPYCGKLLADLGSEVTKVELPPGDPLRRWGPFPEGRPDPEQAGLFRYLNDAKGHQRLDPSEGSGWAPLLELTRDADLLIEDLGPGGLEDRGIQLDQLRSANPGLVVLRISDFGQDGPYAGLPTTPLVRQAASGWLATRGSPDREPVYVGGRVPEFVGGAYAALAGLTALRQCDRGAEAAVIDVSLLETETATLSYPMLMRETMDWLGLPHQARTSALLGIVKCKDGYIGINSLTGQHWQDICALTGLPEYAEKQIEVMLDPEVRRDFYVAAQPWLDANTAREILDLCQSLRIPAAPVGDGANLPHLEQYAARDFFRPHSNDAPFLEPGLPYRLGQMERPATSTKPQPTDTTSDRLPFDDLVVLDLSTFWAGAYLGCYLGAFGADVIKVESAQRPDGFRFTGTFPFAGDDWYERSGLFQGANLNKRGITLDLDSQEGRDILMTLVESADVLIENFSPRVMENFGLTEDVLLAAKPDLLVVRMPGFGLEGPWKNYVSWAYSIEQTAGMATVTGYQDGPPLNPGGPADPIVGVHAGVALLAALEHRAHTGSGQLIEIPQIEVGAALTAEQVIEFSLNGTVQSRQGNRQRDMVQGVYPTAGDDEWVAISIRNDADWARLCSAMGEPAEFQAQSLATQQGRIDNHDQIDRVIAAWTSTHQGQELVEALQRVGVPAAKALVSAEMYDEPQLNERHFYTALEHPVSGTRRYPGWPFRFTTGSEHDRGAPVRTHHLSPAPTLGQHNEEILRTLVGLNDDQIDDLRSRNIIGTEPLGL